MLKLRSLITREQDAPEEKTGRKSPQTGSSNACTRFVADRVGRPA